MPVVDDGRLVGMPTVMDMLGVFVEQNAEIAGAQAVIKASGDFMTGPR
jgi:hypothetical protein